MIRFCLPTSIILLLISVGGVFLTAQDLLPPPVTQGPVVQGPGYYPHPQPAENHWSPLMVLFVFTSAVTTLSTVVLAFLHGAQKIRLEAQHHLSSMNHQALGNLQNSMAANTAETVKGVVAAGEVKHRVEQLEAKLPVRQSDTVLINEGDVEGHKK